MNINHIWNIFFIFFVSIFFQPLQAQTSYTDSLTAFREVYKSDFLKEERSPLKEDDLEYIDFYAPNKQYRYFARFERTPDKRPFDMATYSGITKKYVQYGWIHFKLNNKSYKLAVYQNLRLKTLPKYADYLFLPFKDGTNGAATYGGGRYIDLKKTDIKNNRIEIDFNKAYNPWCAYADGYNCPIPPATNHLNISIPAGEKNFKKSK